MERGVVLEFPVAELRVEGQGSQSGNVGGREEGTQNLTRDFSRFGMTIRGCTHVL